jgi:pantetheine-phosphate adenylyltransferase
VDPVTATVRRAVCPGSYDPVTQGHLDVIVRAAALHDEVVVAVLHNPAKAGTFTVEERIAFIERAVARRDSVIVKGLRGATDFDYELPMALMNRHLTGIETVFVPGDPALAHVSSSLVKEVARFGGDVTGLVPAEVRDALVDRLRADG